MTRHTLLLLFLYVTGAVSKPTDWKKDASPPKTDVGTSRVVCYFPNWGRTVEGEGRYTVDDIDPELCTHIVYAFAFIEDHGTDLVPTDPLDYQNYARLNALKRTHPSLRTVLAVGGYDMGSEPWEFVTSNPGRLQQFTRNVVSYITQHGFDGVDIDWEYPTTDTTEQYVQMLRSLREEIDEHPGGRLLLTAALSALSLNVYSLPTIHYFLDFANVMTYDYHGYWGPPGSRPGTTTYFHSGLYGQTPDHNQAQNWTLHQYLEYGFPHEKFVLGIPTYGRTFTLSNPDNHGVGAPTSGPGDKAQYTDELGVLSYYEICRRLLYAGYTRVYRNHQEVPYAYGGDQWVGYDDVQSVHTKIQFAHDQNLGGVMYWDLSKDDFSNMCGTGRYPLIRLAKQAIPTLPPTEPTTRRTLPATTTRRTLPTTTTRRTLPTTTTTTRRTLPTTTTRRTLPTTTTRRTLPTTTTRQTFPTTTPTERTLPPRTTTRRSIPIQCYYEGQFIRDPVDCSVYYVCSGGVPIEMNCGEGTVFDTLLHTCNHPLYVDCSLFPTPYPEQALDKEQNAWQHGSA